MSSGRVEFTSIKSIIVLLLTCWSVGANAQSWKENPGNFLEPNRFAIVAEAGDPYLWIEAGFGRDIVRSPDANVGLEALIWSRLRNLSEFRFPVETADYFFGAYATFPLFGELHRFRISHISAHLVDGSDSVTGGSSSRFSKEFVQIERSYRSKLLYFPVFGTVGARYTFHQVTKLESQLTFPSSVNVGLWQFGRTDLQADSLGLAGMLFATVSGAAGPSIPSASYGLTARFAFNTTTALDLFARYYDGVSRAGVEGTRNEEQIEIGVRVVPFDWFE
jgi:hypothetical protein